MAKKKSKSSKSSDMDCCHPMSAESKRQQKEWEAQSDARTLMDAEKIRGDKERLAAARGWAQRQVSALENLKKK